MRKTPKVLLAAIVSLVLAPSALAATPAPVTIPAVAGVSATWVTGEGFIVNWVPVSGTAKSSVTGYTVTSSTGQTCLASGFASNECVFSSSKVPFGFKPFIKYTFTVVANAGKLSGPVSAPSNSVGWFGAPAYPTFVAGKTVSDNQLDVQWIPDEFTGGAPINGYKVYYWPLNQDAEKKMVTSSTNSVSLVGLTKSTWYVIAVQSCNYYGCTTSDWAYQATTPAAASTSKTLLPRTISGGSASTTCWNAILDGGNPASTSATLIKALTACPVPVKPSTWPQVDPTATKSPNLPIATKFSPKSSFSLANASYSMSYKWNDTNINTTNFTRTRSLAPRNYESLTPSVCSIILKDGVQQAHYLSAGTCTIKMTIAEDETYEATAPITSSFVVKP